MQAVASLVSVLELELEQVQEAVVEVQVHVAAAVAAVAMQVLRALVQRLWAVARLALQACTVAVVHHEPKTGPVKLAEALDVEPKLEPGQAVQVVASRPAAVLAVVVVHMLVLPVLALVSCAMVVSDRRQQV